MSDITLRIEVVDWRDTPRGEEYRSYIIEEIIEELRFRADTVAERMDVVVKARSDCST